MKKAQVIAIDGVAYSGKSTVARALAKRTGFAYINTGHMYRALAKLALEAGLSLQDAQGVGNLARRMKFEFKNEGGHLHTVVNGRDWTLALDDYQIVEMASLVAGHAQVREVLTLRQQAFAGPDMMIMEGRDIGSSVFPNAAWKFFMIASLEVRARRMIKLMSDAEKMSQPPIEILIGRIRDIDERDRTRPISPLRICEDAIVYDNSGSPTPEEDAFILSYYLNRSDEILKNAELLKHKVEC